MENFDAPMNPRRGTAILIATIIVVSGIAAIVIVPRGLKIVGSSVRIAVIDSGINDISNLGMAMVAEKSFINESYGYSSTDPTTEDSNPDSIQHGTIIAKILTENAENVAIVNAKVVTSRNLATVAGIVNAIEWSVEEADCEIINLSLGSAIVSSDSFREIIRWAFRKGVVIVAAAGNNGRGGIVGTSIESPSLYPEVICVGAVDEEGDLYEFSARGPLSDRTIKPDICAVGVYNSNDGIVFGTSFATPRVTAAAAEIIRYCKINELKWTPGMVKAVLMQGAKQSHYEPWETGAGLVDLEYSLRFVESVSKMDGLPMIAYATPRLNPFEFERWYVNTTIYLTISLFCSGYGEFGIEYAGSAKDYIIGPSEIAINQSGTVEIQLYVNSTKKLLNLQGVVYFSEDNYRNVWSQFQFDAYVQRASVAFDFTHTSWKMDSIYGQFRNLYTALSILNISVESIQNRGDITISNLQRFDGVIVFNPCSWSISGIGNSLSLNESIQFTENEIATYFNYWNNSGNLMILGLSPEYSDIQSANLLLNSFDYSFINISIPLVTTFLNGVPSTYLVDSLSPHPIMDGINSFDFNGCPLEVPSQADVLATAEVITSTDNGTITEQMNLISTYNTSVSGRIVVSGSNFFMDNYALEGFYQSNQNIQLAYQSIYWLLGII
ncbi:MAG: S8 family serine peptidase [Candidatus Lokiarchaeota archaeon]|nr:S8 family serine peptidase [Candidatus Lokiarchaeota archaeon]